jgi:hypothetical protein
MSLTGESSDRSGALGSWKAQAEKKAASCSQKPSQPSLPKRSGGQDQSRSAAGFGRDQNNLGSALWDLGSKLQGEEGLNRQRVSVGLLREVVSYHPDDVSRHRLASALGSLAFNLILNRQTSGTHSRASSTMVSAMLTSVCFSTRFLKTEPLRGQLITLHSWSRSSSLP